MPTLPSSRLELTQLLEEIGSFLRRFVVFGWRIANGRPDDGAFVFPGVGEQRWTLAAYQSWRRRAFAKAARQAAVPDATPYTLRHSFCSLLLAEGRNVIYVARQLGHSANLTLSTYGHVIDEFADAEKIDAQAAIQAARTRLVPRSLSQPAFSASNGPAKHAH